MLALSAMVGRLCAMMSVIIPGYLIVVMAGRERALEVLPAIVACGVSFAGMQFFVSNYVGPELTDIMSSLTCIVVMVLVLKIWRPKTIMRLEGDKPATRRAKRTSAGEMFAAWLPYLLLVVVRPGLGRRRPSRRRSIGGPTCCIAASLPKIPTLLNGMQRARPAQPDHAHAAGDARSRRHMPPLYELNWLSASGTACFLATIAAAIVLARQARHDSSASTRPHSSSCRWRC